MYVCVCNAVTDGQIRSLARRGVDSIEELRALTNCSGTCGQCLEHAEEVLAQALAERRMPLIQLNQGMLGEQPA
ncbi:MAG: (2Fe-2S)-binding protein [Wenzhouxiangellaceae bacterium]|nr:(2Fe-2S)-binding protein [Wenzhouxiangellaceae bacterium]